MREYLHQGAGQGTSLAGVAAVDERSLFAQLLALSYSAPRGQQLCALPGGPLVVLVPRPSPVALSSPRTRPTSDHAFEPSSSQTHRAFGRAYAAAQLLLV